MFHQVKDIIAEEGPWRIIEHVIVLCVVVSFLRRAFMERRGKKGIKDLMVKMGIRLGQRFSFLRNKISSELEKEASKTVSDMLNSAKIRPIYREIPQNGEEKEKLLQEIRTRKEADIDPTVGKTFAYVYEHSKNHSEFTAKCFNEYIHYNALNPIVFNSLRVFEVETVKMVSSLFHGDDKCVGNVTSCGTESLVLAMKTYRDYRGKG